MSYIQIMTTTASAEEAQQIAQTLVERRLAACVQVAGPIQSTYRWQGAIERGSEWLCTIKTRRDLYDQVAQAIRQNHSYEVPEILATEIAAGDPDYLAWLDAQVQP